jgi:4'-phosphopantetheinyl transferase
VPREPLSSEGAGAASPAIRWPAAGPEAAARAGDAVDVWCAALELPEAELARLEATLAPEERARAARFVFERDRSRFVAARGLLRQILAAYLGAPPEALRFCYSARGKPFLEQAEAGLEFNLAHSGGLALYAVAGNRPVGVDLERIRAEIDVEGIAARFFSPKEAAALRAMPQAERLPAFFRCWTRKEALLKAWGEGLPFGLDRFSVSLDPQQAAMVETPLEAREAAEWRLWPLEPAPGYVGALAVRGSRFRVRCLRWRAF